MKQLLVLSLVLVMVSGCGGGNNSSQNTNVEFTAFVIDEINNTSETIEPADINQTDFIFSENESQFDSIL